MPKDIRIAPQPGPQTEFLQTDADIAIFGGARGGGKGLPVSADVVTPWGKKAIGKLKAGSKVCATDGTVTEVIAVYRRGVQPCYKLTWHTGDETVCDEDHLWYGWKTNKSRKIANERISGENSAKKWTTLQIYEEFGHKQGRGKHRFATPTISAPVRYNVHGEQRGTKVHIGREDLDPYVLGVILGDECCGNGQVTFCSADQEIVDEVAKGLGRECLPYPSSEGRTAPTYPLPDTKEQLNLLGVLGCKSHDKFIPRIYKLGSVEERWALLQGLMDTDGWAEQDGDTYFTSVSEQLAKDVSEVARSLGAITTITEKTPTYTHNGEKLEGRLAYRVRIKIPDAQRLFRLTRKKDLAKEQPQSMGIYLKSIEKVEPRETVCISVSHPNSLFVTGDFIVTHNSYALLFDAMRYCIDNKWRDENGEIVDRPAVANYNALLLRKSYQQIYKAGGLYSASQKIYPYLGAHFTQTTNRWTFPSKATVDFGHMEHENDKDKYLGLELPWIGFDEVNQFSESQFWFMTSSNRSTLGVPSRIRATCNPDSASWVAKFIEWWIDQETGWPIPERDGKIRWFVRLENTIYWHNTKEELWEDVKEHFGGDKTYYMPMSATFIRSLLEDNKILEESDRGYRAKLMQMPEVDRQRFLEGNWLVSPSEGSEWADHPEYFDRDIWTEKWPDSFISSAIFIDPSKGKTTRSDFSAIVFVGLHQGKMYVHSDIKRRPAEDIVRDAMRMYNEYQPNMMGIEENNFQDLLAPIFDQECEKQGLPPFEIFMVRSIEKKEVRIRSLGPFLERRKILLHKSSPTNRIMYQQLKDFGIKGVHDDGPDALEGAIRVLRALGTDPIEQEIDPPDDYEDEPEVEYAL